MTAPSIDRPDLLANDALIESLPPLLALATALTGDSDSASRLVAASLTRRPTLVRDALNTDLPETRLRSLVVQQFLSRRGLRTDPSADLATMPRRQRAAVVLRDGFQLTALEIAAVLDRPAATVIADLEAGPDSHAAVAALMAAAPGPNDVALRLRDSVRAHRRRRVRFIAIAVVAVALVAGLVAIPTVVLPRLPAPTRSAGEWRYDHEIRPAAGWTVLQRTVTAEVETTEVKPPVAADDPYTCWVRVYVPGAFKTAGSTPAAPLHGRQAVTGTGDTNGFLAWEYGDDAWAQTYCSTLDPESDVLRDVAAMVEFGPSDLKLPFTLSAIPRGYRLSQVSSYPDSNYTEAVFAKTDIVAGEVNLVISAPLDHFAPGGNDQQVGGRTWRFLAGAEPRTCTGDPAGQSICVSGVWPGGDYPAPPPSPVKAPEELRSMAAVLTPADLANPGGWPTGSQLPR